MKRNGWDKMREERLASEKTKKENAKARIYFKETYQSRKENGICVRCGKNDAEDGRVMCRACRLDRGQLYTDILSKKEKIFDSCHSRLWRLRKDMGKCPRCGKNKPDTNRVMCRSCLDKAKERAQAKARAQI